MASPTAWEIATMSASWFAVIEIDSASSPSMRVREVCGSVTSSTLATSPMVTTVPGWVWLASGKPLMASRDATAVPPWTGRDAPSSVTLPSGSVMPFASSAWLSACGFSPFAARAA